MTILDTSVWAAYFNDEDSQYAKAQKALSDARLPIAIPEYVVLETTTVLTQRAGKAAADRFLDLVSDIDDMDLLPTDERFFLEIIQAFRDQPSRQLSFTDVALLILARTHAVVTFDRQLANAIKRQAKS